MTNPVSGPRVVPTGPPGAPVGGPAGAPGRTAPAGGSGRVGAFLGTRNGKLMAAGGAVAGYALFKRIRSSKDPGSDGSAAGDAAAGTAGGGIQGGVDTSATDVYNSLEPLIEHLSGFSDAADIQKQLAALQASVNGIKQGPSKGVLPGETKPNGPGGTPSQKQFTDQLHYVGKAGETVSLDAAVAKYYPGATKQQISNIEYWSGRADNPSNILYWLAGKVPGGFHAKFLGSKANTPAPAGWRK